MHAIVSWCPASIGLVLLGTIGARGKAPQALPPGPRALLFGCSRCENPPPSSHANDVVPARQVLTGPSYRLPAENVMALADDDAAGAIGRPTRANVEREFRRPAEWARPGEPFVIHFSGHGSQQPDRETPDPADPEPDALDETILPSEVGRWDGAVAPWSTPSSTMNRASG